MFVFFPGIILSNGISFESEWEIADIKNAENSFLAGIASEIIIELLLYFQKKYPNHFPELVYPRDRILFMLANSGYRYYSMRNLIIKALKKDLKSATTINFDAQIKNKLVEFDYKVDFNPDEIKVDLTGPFKTGALSFVQGAALVAIIRYYIQYMLAKQADSKA